MKIKGLMEKYGRVFVVPMDHPSGDDTKKLNEIGMQGFVNMVDSLGHDGYIFHSRDYVKSLVKTSKDFFLTVGEQPDDYKMSIDELGKLDGINNLTIFFEVDSEEDKAAVEFYREYVSELKDAGYVVMGMGYPSEKYGDVDYQIVADVAHEIGCDFFKTDFFNGVRNLDLHGMKLFIAGGEYLEDNDFEKFVDDVEKLKVASASFGRNIFEADNPKERINFVLEKFGR
jgi:DhnA family fructose-bisphosphate aldolase class Ia